MDIALNDVYCCDALTLSSQLHDSSIDLILTDIPYKVSRSSSFKTLKDRTNPRTGLDFGEWDYDGFDVSPLYEWERILVDGGHVLIFHECRQLGAIDEAFTQTSSTSTLQYKNSMVWKKTNPYPRNHERRFVGDIEMASLYTKVVVGNAWTFNRQHPQWESCVLTFPVESGFHHHRYHPTQKPLKLMQYLVRLLSNEGNVVLDPYCGGGTSLVAAKSLHRQYIGCDVDETYYSTTKERLASCQLELLMD